MDCPSRNRLALLSTLKSWPDQHRYSKQFGGSYWANTCPHCDAVQGDNFLFLGTQPLFKGLPLRDTPEMKAHHAKAVGQLANFMLRNIGG